MSDPYTFLYQLGAVASFWAGAAFGVVVGVLSLVFAIPRVRPTPTEANDE